VSADARLRPAAPTDQAAARTQDALRNLPRGVIRAYFAALDRIDEDVFRAARKQAFQG